MITILSPVLLLVFYRVLKDPTLELAYQKRRDEQEKSEVFGCTSETKRR